MRSVLTLSTSLVVLSGAAQEITTPIEAHPLALEVIDAESAGAAAVDPASEPSLDAAREPTLDLQELPPFVAPLPLPQDGTAGIGNADVIEMVAAEFGETTIVAAIQANTTRFDVSPRALLALKGAGVSDRVIETMLAAEAAKRSAPATPAAEPTAAPGPSATAAETVADPAPSQAMSPEAMAALSQMLERLAAQSAATESESSEQPEADEVASNVPRAWVHDDGGKGALTPTIAQVAVTDAKRSGNGAFKTLRGLAEKALPFANPTLGLAASGLQGLFRSDDPTVTAVWALLGPSAARTFAPDTAFEIEFGNIPGINPDAYRPAIVQLVPTTDNYRLVGAAKTTVGDAARMPNGPIIEEPVAAQLKQLARGHYRVSLNAPLPPGEYALVLRPIAAGERERRKEAQESLGELMGGGVSQVLYMTWDFAIRS